MAPTCQRNEFRIANKLVFSIINQKIISIRLADTMEAAKQQRMADRQKAFQAKYKMTMEKDIDDKVRKN